MPFGVLQTRGGVEPPGTVFLIDNEHTRRASRRLDVEHVKHGSGKHAGTVLVPQPSDDPNDPLLWPRWKKEAAFFVIFANAVIFATCPGPLLATSTFTLAPLLGVSLGDIALLSGNQLMVVGITGPFVSVLAQKYGKRPQYLFAAVMGVIGTVICIAGKHNFDTLMAGRVIQGFGATAFESLSLATVGDIFYLHERGWRTSLIVLTLACMASLVSIISGQITQNVGYGSLFTILLPFNIAGLIGTIFFLPETQFVRNDETLRSHERVLETDKRSDDSKMAGYEEMIEDVTIRHAPKKTYMQSLAPFTHCYTEKNIFRMFGEIFVHLLNPAVVWILFTSAVMVSFFAGIAYILAQIFSVPPYNLNTAQNGLFNFGAFTGGVIGVSAGYFCDATARLVSRANKGTFEPEFRILVNIPAALLLAVGWFLFMWRVDNPVSNGYYLGAFCHGCICFGITITSTTGGLYILDAFSKYATEIFILQMTTKNLLFYMFSKFINTWELNKGAGDVFRIFGIISMVLLATSIPMYVFGKVNRQFGHKMYTRFGM